ncbi:hypothetical protein ACWEQC_10010 [Streptomyces shenzhenensis]
MLRKYAQTVMGSYTASACAMMHKSGVPGVQRTAHIAPIIPP